MTNCQRFRSDAAKVAALRVVIEMPIVQEAMHAMEQDSPVHSPMANDITPHFALIHSGRCRGYAEYAHTFPLLGTHPKDHSVIEPTEETAEEE